MVSFRTFRRPLFPKPVSWLGLFLLLLTARWLKKSQYLSCDYIKSHDYTDRCAKALPNGKISKPNPLRKYYYYIIYWAFKCNFRNAFIHMFYENGLPMLQLISITLAGSISFARLIKRKIWKCHMLLKNVGITTNSNVKTLALLC